MKALGTHIVCELSGCDPATLTNVDAVREMMIGAAKASRATVMEVAFHRFQPQGVSGVVVLAESHISIHTWPEKGYAAMDFYTCGDHTDPWLACEHAAKLLSADHMVTSEFKRGVLESRGDNQFTHVVSTDHDTRSLSAA
jgi:S-adenosylmethionine decarboxylase